MTSNQTRPVALASIAACLASGALAYAESSSAAIMGREIDEHVRYLASDELEGRGTGERGERLAGEYIAHELARYGLRPGAADGSYFQPFVVEDQPRLRAKPTLRLDVGPWYRDLEATHDFNPLGLSGSFSGQAPLVFAGYGISDEKRGYDDYAGLDVRGKAVLVLRHEPREKEGLGDGSLFTTKAANAKAHGAVALLVVTDPLNHAGDDSVLPFGGGGDAGICVVHVRRSLAEGLLRLAGKDLSALQREIDATLAPRSCELDARLSMNLDIARSEVEARNVVAVLPGTDPDVSDQVLVIGAHYDHLGRGGHGGSLAPRAEGQIHNGADDNASGTAGLLELAQAFAAQPARRTIYFVAFSGEERGLLGSEHFVAHPPLQRERIVAMVNLDMIGRLGKGEGLEVGGAGTAPGFKELIQGAASAEGLTVTLDESGMGPSDHASFYQAKIPVLFFFTGLHDDYHRPSDDAERLDVEGTERVARMAYACARGIADGQARPEYVRVVPQRGGRGGAGRPRLGITLDREHQGPGVAVAEAVDGQPAAVAGLRAGDVIVRLGEQAVESMRDLFSALASHKPGDEVEVVVRRAGAEQHFKVKLGG